MYILKASKTNAKLWLPIEEIESEALTQIRNAASLPWAVHVAVMPDAHFGKGATVGSVIALKNAVSPACVGVDLACGMGAVKTNITADQLPDNLKEIRNEIEKRIPVGFNSHGSNRKFPNSIKYGENKKRFDKLLNNFETLHEKVQNLKERMYCQIGTLGGGNHFIELCLDTKQNVWLMLHSGSRNIGKELAEIHIKIAKTLAHNNDLPDRDLAVFLSGTKEMENYRRDLFWAQDYALMNRIVMLEEYKQIITEFFPTVKFDEEIHCHHNYVSEEIHFGEELIVTRKGAISAKAGQFGIIPGSMGTKSYIVKGLGNPDSLMSASHGAGRKMSRGAAKRHFTIKDLVEQTEGVECRKDPGVLDEIPGAYKSIDMVMKRQSDLVEIVAELKQILCVKG